MCLHESLVEKLLTFLSSPKELNTFRVLTVYLRNKNENLGIIV